MRMMTKRPNACFVSLSFAGLVVLARSLNPIPSRTRPLNSSAPMVLWLKPWESRSLPGLPRTKQLLFTCHDQTKRRFPSGRRRFCFFGSLHRMERRFSDRVFVGLSEPTSASSGSPPFTGRRLSIAALDIVIGRNIAPLGGAHSFEICRGFAASGSPSDHLPFRNAPLGSGRFCSATFRRQIRRHRLNRPQVASTHLCTRLDQEPSRNALRRLPCVRSFAPSPVS
jgi:hypothetical protein